MKKNPAKRPTIKKTIKPAMGSKKNPDALSRPPSINIWEGYLGQLQSKVPIDLKKLRAFINSHQGESVPRPIVIHLLDRINGKVRLKDGRPPNDPMNQDSLEFWVYHWIHNYLGKAWSREPNAEIIDASPFVFGGTIKDKKDLLKTIKLRSRQFEENLKKVNLRQEEIEAGEPQRSRDRFKRNIDLLENEVSSLPSTNEQAYVYLANKSQKIFGKKLSAPSIKRLFLSYQRKLSVRS